MDLFNSHTICSWFFDVKLWFIVFNSVPNLIVIMFNLMYPVFYVGFLCKGCVWERVWRLKAKWRAKKFLRVAHVKPSSEVKHVLSTWLECEETWQMVIVGFCECLAGKAFPWDTRETIFFPICHIWYTKSLHTLYIPTLPTYWDKCFSERKP